MLQDGRAGVPKRPVDQDLAEKVANAAQAKATELGITMSVAVVDESGNMAYFVRGDTASFITFETARGKAILAAGFRRPTVQMLEGFKGNPAFWAGLAGKLKMQPGGGGDPLTLNGTVIGGVGCGGGIGDQDELCSAAGAAAVNT
jgi:glc operon protein GlcG